MALDRTVSVKLKAEVAGYVAGLRQAGAATSSFAKGIETGAVKNRQHLDKLGSALAVVGTIAATGVVLAVKAFADFDKAMSGVEAATHESAANMQLLRDAALEAGAQTAFSATEAAGAVEELAKAGVSTADILGGGLTGALDLAAAGSLEVGAAAEIAASAMTQFGLSGSDIPHVADLLAAAAGKAQGSVEDMGMALNQSGLVAATFEYSIEQTTGVLAEFAAAGLTGSDAGTSLKTMLLRLANPSQQAADAMTEFGISAYDAGGQMVSPTELAGELADGLGTLDDATRNAALSTIFGSDAIRAASVLLKDGADAAAGWESAVNDDGFAAETARLKMNNLAGDIEKLKGSFETFLISLGEGANGPLRGFVQGVEDIVNKLGRLSPEQQETILKTLALVAALALGAATAIKAVTALAALRTAMTVLTGSTAGATTALGRFNTAVSLGKLAAATGGIIAAAVAADQLYTALGKASVPNVEVNKLANEMLKLGEGAQLTDSQIKLFGANAGFLGRDLKGTDDIMGELVETMREAGSSEFLEKLDRLGGGDAEMAKLTETLTTMDGALAQLVSGGHGEVAARQFNLLKDAALEAHLPLAKLDELLPQYTQAVADIPDGAPKIEKTAAALEDERQVFLQLNPLQKTAEEVTKDYTDRQDEAATKVSEHADALDHLIENLGLVNDVAVDATRAQIDYNQGIRDVGLAVQEAVDAEEKRVAAAKKAGEAYQDNSKAVRDNATSLDENTDSGAKNVLGLLDLIEAAEKNATAVGKKADADGRSRTAAAEADKAYEASIKSLRDAAVAAGYNKDEVDKLIASHARVEPVVETIFNNPGLDKAITGSKDFKGWLDKLPKSKQVEISAPGAEGAQAQVKAVRDYVNELHDKAIEIRVRYISTTSAVTGSLEDARARAEGGLGRASGGYISGAGSGTSDSIAAWLSNGEYVINAAATSANRSLLDAINRGGLTSGATATRAPNSYASGGPVQQGRGITLEQHVTVANLDELNRKTQTSLRDTMTMANLRGV